MHLTNWTFFVQVVFCYKVNTMENKCHALFKGSSTSDWEELIKGDLLYAQ